MEKPKLIFNHPLGNANSRAVLEGVAREGLLDEFHTSVAAFNSGLWSALARTRLGQEFNRRRFAEDVRRQTRQKPFRELGRIAANRLGLSALTTHETGRFSVDAVFRGLDRRVARRLGAGRGRAVYAY
ncbi:MAG: glycosyl transferase family 1, partial [Pseudomonadota bacterium]